MRRFGDTRLLASILALASALAVGFPGAAQEPFARKPVTIRSQSGQFIVHGLPMGPAPFGGSTSVVQYLRLDPNLIAVSLERIREALQNEMKWPMEWRQVIHVATEPIRGENTRVTITSVRFETGRSYRVLFPEIVDRDRFIGGSVKVILTEFANRRAGSHDAELPAWLVEGLTAYLMARSLPVLALEPSTEFNHRAIRADPLADARLRLREREALSFDDLGMPTEEMLTGTQGQHFRACAHVFVHELLRLPDGPILLRRLLERLPENLNWQTTFLEVYQLHFSRLLDVDRWYALAVAGLTGKNIASVFPPIASWEQLERILATPVEVRTTAGDLPLRTDMKLQRLVREWEFSRQQPVLIEKLRSLQALRGRAASEVVPLVDGYVEALTEYLGPRAAAGGRTAKRPRGEPARLLQKLDALDARRAALAR